MTRHYNNVQFRDICYPKEMSNADHQSTFIKNIHGIFIYMYVIAKKMYFSFKFIFFCYFKNQLMSSKQGTNNKETTEKIRLVPHQETRVSFPKFFSRSRRT